MNVKHQKLLASKILNVGKRRIKIDPSKLPEVKEAITKTDIRSLIAKKIITVMSERGHSRSRSRFIQQQKRKGKRKGRGSKKGTRNTRVPRKRSWIQKVRSQRKFIHYLKDTKQIAHPTFRDVYKKVTANRFRSIRLIKLYLEENELIKKNDVQKKA